MAIRRGAVGDAIIAHFKAVKRECTVAEIREAVEKALGGPVPPSSVRSYLNNNTPALFTRVKLGRYRFKNAS